MVGVSSPWLGNSGGAGFVALADDRRPLRCVHVVENADQLVFDELALPLDDENVGKPFGKTPGAGLLQGPGQRHLIDAQADRRCAAASSMPRSASAWRRSR